MKSRFPVLLKSLVPTWIIKPSDPRSPWSPCRQGTNATRVNFQVATNIQELSENTFPYDVVFEIKQQCQMKNIDNIPMVVSVTGVIHIMLNQSINYLKLPPSPMSQFHKLVTKIKIVIIILLIIMCVPHRWIIKSLKLIDIDNKIIPCTKRAVCYWKTRMRKHAEGEIKERKNLEIQFGIFQGHSLSPLIFCISLSPFIGKLNKLNTG